MSEVKYSKEHEWIKLEGDTATIGITKHACFVIPMVAVSPSNLIHSCSFEYLTSLISLLLLRSFFYKMAIHKYLLDVFFP